MFEQPADVAPQEGTDFRITVVIPTHNRRDLLLDTIRMSLDQVGIDVTVIVVDDASVDGTADAVDERFVQAGEPVQLIRREVSGGAPGPARNAGLRAARTRWVAFLDDDDLWAPGKLRAQLVALAEQPEARWSAVGCVAVDDELRITKAIRMHATDDLAGSFLLENQIPGSPSGVVVDRELALRIGGFDEDAANIEDWDMWLRLAQQAPLAYVDEPLLGYRTWGGSMSANVALIGAKREFLRQRNAAIVPVAAERTQSLVWHQHLARGYALAGSRWGAARHFVAAATTGHQWGQLAYAAAAVVSLALVRWRLLQMDRRSVPASWRAAADGWLAPWRAAATVRSVSAGAPAGETRAAASPRGTKPD